MIRNDGCKKMEYILMHMGIIEQAHPDEVDIEEVVRELGL